MRFHVWKVRINDRAIYIVTRGEHDPPRIITLHRPHRLGEVQAVVKRAIPATIGEVGFVLEVVAEERIKKEGEIRESIP